jgi:hypothetical protein
MISTLNGRVKELEGKLRKIENLFGGDTRKAQKADPLLGTTKIKLANSNSEKNLQEILKTTKTNLNLSSSFNSKARVVSASNTPQKKLVNVELYKPLIPRARLKTSKGTCLSTNNLSNKPPLLQAPSNNIKPLVVAKTKKESFFITESESKEHSANNTEGNYTNTENKETTYIDKLNHIRNRTRNLLEFYNQRAKLSKQPNEEK